MKMSSNLYRSIVLLVLITAARASPKPLSCMSYLEDERSMQDDDDDSDEEPFDAASQAAASYSYSHNELADNDLAATVAGTMTPAQTQEPRPRLCQPDYTFCFSLWRQTENGTHLEKQGCWKESTERNATCSQTECTSSAPTSRNNSLYYCCCSGDLCNRNVSVVEPAPLQLSKAISMHNGGGGASSPSDSPVWRSLILVFGVATVLMLSISLVALIYCRALGEKPEPEEAPLAPSGPGYSSNLRNVDNMNLICMLGSGKYGTVMKGLLHDEEVAVKIFPEAHHQYYINERNIYSLPLMDCPALLAYFGYDERRTMDDKVEYQLVLSLASLGCLQDWLIANSADFETFCGMSRSITRGLSHLHTELRRGDDYKPCIAHRDLNTRNILVKADRTCCIADFGFALKVFGSKYEYKGEVAMAETKSINEVGTLRYMAPELLEGAVNLRDCETSLKQMDVYALGLVLWEVATRCSDFYPPAQTVPPYKAPYELEVGSHPSFDQMQALVVHRKARPLFPAGWGGGPAAKLVRDTCEDCWDQDAEARLTSLCAEERMHEVSGLRPRIHPYTQAVSPLLSANNLAASNSSAISSNGELGPSNLQLAAAASMAGRRSPDVLSCDTASMLVPPPNQQVLPHQDSFGFASGSSGTTHPLGMPRHTEKNHLIGGQQQLQPYQGRNPCLERNLAPVAARPAPVLVEKSKKHSFQSGQENSFSCLEDDVCVEDLISSGGSKKFNSLPHPPEPALLGQGFPKQQNTDKKLRGWHGVRALIQKRLFRNDGGGGSGASFGGAGLTGPAGASGAEIFPHYLGYGDEKSNLVENRYAGGGVGVSVVKGNDLGQAAAASPKATISFIEDKGHSRSMTKTTTLDGLYSNSRRPNNLDLSPMTAAGGSQGGGGGFSDSLKAAGEAAERTRRPEPKRVDTRTSTPSHVVPRVLSTSNVVKPVNQPRQDPQQHEQLLQQQQRQRFLQNNNNEHKQNNNNHHKEVAPLRSQASRLHGVADDESSDVLGEPQFRRQRSLEVFREVFSGRGSTERLRDPSQRVKTPGDVPPSVRKVRASKTLSLYDDRMMDSSTLNIL